MFTGMFANHQVFAFPTDIFRRHNFISLPTAQNAMLMDTGFVRKSILSDYRLITRNAQTGQIGYQTTSLEDFAGIDPSLGIEIIFAGNQVHNDFFKCGISGAFADSINTAFHLGSTSPDSGERISYGIAQIIMTMDTNNRLPNCRHFINQVANPFGKFLRFSIADRIGNVNSCSTGFQGGLHNFTHIFEASPGTIFG
ncbi:MAG: hypothetical protein BWX60_00625 [Candidatus Marinimicrobia bacterium ADurb.Bin030]|nr:MAG: hypothetical protein BWX60_00625 [Candidatus Marinimicrobia bacterium ADurb.Bin030]